MKVVTKPSPTITIPDNAFLGIEANIEITMVDNKERHSLIEIIAKATHSYHITNTGTPP